MTNFERSRKVYAISYEEVHINFAIKMRLILTIFSPFSKKKLDFLQHPLLHAKLFIRIYFFRIVWYVTKKHLLSYAKLGTFMITVKKKTFASFSNILWQIQSSFPVQKPSIARLAWTVVVESVYWQPKAL